MEGNKIKQGESPALFYTKNLLYREEDCLIAIVPCVPFVRVEVGFPLKSRFVTTSGGKKKYRMMFVVIMIHSKMKPNLFFM